mgnify:CR=1 FL=1
MILEKVGNDDCVKFACPTQPRDSHRIRLRRFKVGGGEDVPEGGELGDEFGIEDAADGDLDAGHFQAGNDAGGMAEEPVVPLFADPLVE